jgi:hypothetical protein
MLLLLITILITAAPVSAETCLDCHKEIAGQLKGNSHHIQQVQPDGRHCYACHWEAATDGSIDPEHHQRDSRTIDLVIWQDGKRPTVFSAENSVTYSMASVGTELERSAFSAITRHCLSCHSDATGRKPVFSGDPNSPASYAWDGESIASRYTDKTVTTWGKYSTPTTNRKMQVTKALSAHGNAVANSGGWSPTEGYDGRIPDTRSGRQNVECFDCHNSHGSNVEGITTSYRTNPGARNGGILKQTSAGLDGYRMTYSPSPENNAGAKNPYNPGAGLCFDCHETASAGSTPWGYDSTFGATEPVMGYKDTHRFGPGVKGSTSRHASRQGRSEIVSSHLKSGSFLRYSATTAINGLCTPCHDPHGVSRSLGRLMPYAVPLLKGSWLTSPYREDATPANAPAKGNLSRQQGAAGSGVSGTLKGPVSLPGMQYNVDRNTFGPDGKISETDKEFAGLCLKCHQRLKPSSESKTDRIHRAVKGWGNNREHSFPCSKCHQPHNSGLPRLMQTNCFQEGPANLRENSGLAWLPEGKKSESSAAAAAGTKKSGKTEMVGCHVRQFGKGGAKPAPKGEDSWKQKAPW